MRADVSAYLGRVARRATACRAVEGAGVGLIAAGLSAAVVQVVLWGFGVPGALIAIGLLALGTVLGAGAGAVLGAGVSRAAGMLDARAGLDERLTTAAELARAGDEGPAARCVYAQALEALNRPEVRNVSLWRRTRRTGAGVALVLMLCGTLAILPARRTRAERLAGALDEMPRKVRRELADQFRSAAADRPAEVGLLVRAAKAVEIRDPAALRKVLDELRRRGLEVTEIVAPEVLSRATGAGGGEDIGGTAAAKPATGNDPKAAPARGGSVPVWDPLYEKFVRLSGSDGNGGADRGGPVVAYEDAWALARRRAGDALARGAVPHEYRRMVREFFAERD